MKQKLTEMKDNIDKHGYSQIFSILFSAIARTSRQNINKDIKDLKNWINEHDLLGIYRKRQSTTAKYTFFSTVHGALTKIGIFGAIKQVSINLKEMKSYKICFSDDSTIKLRIYKISKKKIPKYLELIWVREIIS